jgi:hypothetical protein
MKQALIELAQATLIAATIGFPFILYFWRM